MMKLSAAVATALAVAAPALAAPPQDALPLSEVLRGLEEQGELAYVQEVEWDDDGHWEIEYYRPDGSKVEVELDPRTGEPR